MVYNETPRKEEIMSDNGNNSILVEAANIVLSVIIALVFLKTINFTKSKVKTMLKNRAERKQQEEKVVKVAA